MFETGQTCTRQPLDFSFVSRSLKRYSTKSSSFERTTRLVEHYTACEHAQSKSTKSHTRGTMGNLKAGVHVNLSEILVSLKRG